MTNDELQVGTHTTALMQMQHRIDSRRRAERDECAAEVAACLEFLRAELNWNLFREDFLIGDQVVSGKNADRLREFLKATGHGLAMLKRIDDQRAKILELQAALNREQAESEAVREANARQASTIVDQSGELERLRGVKPGEWHTNRETPVEGSVVEIETGSQRLFVLCRFADQLFKLEGYHTLWKSSEIIRWRYVVAAQSPGDEVFVPTMRGDTRLHSCAVTVYQDRLFAMQSTSNPDYEVRRATLHIGEVVTLHIGEVVESPPLEVIPSDVRWNESMDRFETPGTSWIKGREFYNKWYLRRDEFPTHPPAGKRFDGWFASVKENGEPYAVERKKLWSNQKPCTVIVNDE